MTEFTGMHRRGATRLVVVAIATAMVLALLAGWGWHRHTSSVGSVRTSPQVTMPMATGQNGMDDMNGMPASGMDTGTHGMTGMPGTSSGMRMASRGIVQLTADQLHQFGITFGIAAERTLARQVRTVGVVTVDERRQVDVAPRFGGYVERLYVDETGAPVRQGEPLMDVYSPELVAAQQELLDARQLERSIGTSGVPGVPAFSTDLVTAARRRFALWDISEAQVDAILRTGKVRRTLTLAAPASGVVLEKHVVRGQAIRAGETLYRIADLRGVWIDVALREQDAGAVRPGSPVVVDLAAYPGHPTGGRVAYVYPTLDQAARTVRARVEIANPSGRVKPGMYATVTLTTPTRSALTVPTSAILNTGNHTLVFVDLGGGRLRPTEIVTGEVSGDYTEVISGIEPKQRVVLSAQYLLDSEANLAEVMKSMMGQMNMSDMQTMTDMPGMRMSGGSTSGGSMPQQRR